MPLPTQTIEIPLSSGLDQKTGELKRAPGTLLRAINVETDKVGRINKRRGYQYVNTSTATVATFSSDVVNTRLAIYRDELVIFTYDTVMALGSRQSQLRGEDAVVHRGPCNRGNGSETHISTSRTTGDTFQ